VSLVVDSNVLLAQAVDLEYSVVARRRFRVWLESGTLLFAPALWQYEVTSALRRLISRRELTSKQADAVLDTLYALGVESVAPTPELQRSALRWAERLGRSKAYDSAYLAVGERLGATFWTADRHLVRNAQSLGLDWVQDATTTDSETSGDADPEPDHGDD
jgi:predicted nucleic acid-binding protein